MNHLTERWGVWKTCWKLKLTKWLIHKSIKEIGYTPRMYCHLKIFVLSVVSAILKVTHVHTIVKVHHIPSIYSLRPVTYICISELTIIGSDKGLSPGHCQSIIWTNAGILYIGPSGTKFNEMLIEIHLFTLIQENFISKCHLENGVHQEQSFLWSVLLGSGICQLYPYIWGLLLWHWGNHLNFTLEKSLNESSKI